MTPSPSSSDHDASGNPPEGAPTPTPGVNPSLSANLSADYAALQNDMEQAKELAADFQRQLAGKSNEFAQLKQLFEKATADLAHLHEGIVELRAERHRLANESMRAIAFQLKLAQVTAERDRLRVDVEHVRKALDLSAQEMASALRDRDAQIAVLVIDLVNVKEALEVARRELAGARPPAPSRVASPVDRGQVTPSVPPQEKAKVEEAEDYIDISFGT